MHPDKPKPKRIAKARVIKAVQAEYGTLNAFAAFLGKNRQHVSDVLGDRATSAPIAAVAAALLGAMPHQIWPRRYAEDGGPRATYNLRRTA